MWCFIRHMYIVHHNQMLNIRNTHVCLCMLTLNVLNVMGNKQWNQVCESAVRHCKIFESLMIQRTRYIRPIVEMCCWWAAVQYDIRYVNANATAFINATNDTEFIYKMPKLLIFPIRANSFSFRVETNGRHYNVHVMMPFHDHTIILKIQICTRLVFVCELPVWILADVSGASSARAHSLRLLLLLFFFRSFVCFSCACSFSWMNSHDTQHTFL